jgi:hypothetical protein
MPVMDLEIADLEPTSPSMPGLVEDSPWPLMSMLDLDERKSELPMPVMAMNLPDLEQDLEPPSMLPMTDLEVPERERGQGGREEDDANGRLPQVLQGNHRIMILANARASLPVGFSALPVGFSDHDSLLPLILGEREEDDVLVRVEQTMDFSNGIMILHEGILRPMTLNITRGDIARGDPSLVLRPNDDDSSSDDGDMPLLVDDVPELVYSTQPDEAQIRTILSGYAAISNERGAIVIRIGEEHRDQWRNIAREVGLSVDFDDVPLLVDGDSSSGDGDIACQ